MLRRVRWAGTSAPYRSVGLGERVGALHGDVAVLGAVVAVADDPLAGLDLDALDRPHRQSRRLGDMEVEHGRHRVSLGRQTQRE